MGKEVLRGSQVGISGVLGRFVGGQEHYGVLVVLLGGGLGRLESLIALVTLCRSIYCGGIGRSLHRFRIWGICSRRAAFLILVAQLFMHTTGGCSLHEASVVQ